MEKAFVIREVGSEDRKRFAVVTHGEAFEGKWKRRCLWVGSWYEKEDDARADAHRQNYPDYD
jgi:hypothetical protein